jgi:fucose 4-O-acetylase-like acetyltransferase
MPAPERRPDLDWLRVGGVYLLLVFHSAKVFDRTPFYHLKNHDQSTALTVFTSAVHQWHMPLLFVLAGWSLTPSLDRRTRRQFLRERRLRLLVPLAFGCALLMPPIKYLELRHLDHLHESFLQFLPSFYTRLDHFTWSQLWFLAYLFVFTALYLGLFERLRRSATQITVVRPALVYAPIVPLALVQLTLRARWPGYQNLYDDWANFAYYSLFFIGGFFLSRWPAVERAVHRERRRATVIGLAALGLMVPGLARARLPHPGLNPEWLIGQTLSAVAGFCIVVALLGFAASWLRHSSRALAYLRDSQMPVYVLHQLAIVAIASYVITLHASIATKYLFVLATSTAATLASYQLLVRRRPLLRTLLGTKNPPPAQGPSRRWARALRDAARSRQATGSDSNAPRNRTDPASLGS